MIDDEALSDIWPATLAIIREVYDSENARTKFELELERALISGVKVIVIEPEPLGEETARWIYVGNILHKIAVYSGICSIVSGFAWNSLACAPFGIISVLSAGCYTLAWQWDPCCKYQVERDHKNLDCFPVLRELAIASPVILVHTSNRRKIIMHNTISVAAVAICLWKLYSILK